MMTAVGSSRRWRWRGICAAGLLAVALWPARPAAGAAATPEEAIGQALTGWMDAFNAGRSDEVCGLFAPDLVMTYQGLPSERDYAEFCANLQRALADPSRRLHYALVIREIIVSGDLAVARLVWTLTSTAKDGSVTGRTDEYSLDVFRREPDGHWKITRFLAYPVPPE